MSSTLLTRLSGRASAPLLLLGTCVGISAAQAQIVNTPNQLYVIAGGSTGTNNGTGAAAQFNTPIGIAKSQDGNLYVADQQNHAIRKITSAGVVTTLAGGTAGSNDGALAGAQFNLPTGITAGPSNTLYIADYGNSKIRKIDLGAGTVSTVAGDGTCGSANGVAASAQFCNPAGLTLDGAGNIYVADTSNDVIRKIDTGGNVTTVAGTPQPPSPTCLPPANGAGPAASFCNPGGITMHAGDLYVADTGFHAIRKVTTAGDVTTFAGTLGISGSANGTGAAARFDAPFGIMADGSGNLYVGESNNRLVRKITSGAVVTTVAGTAGSPANTTPGPLPGTLQGALGLTLVSSNQLAFATGVNEILGANFGAGTFNFTGFFQPVDNTPVLNAVRAGSAIPVKFSLGGNQGMNIFASGFPASRTVACDTASPIDSVEETVNPGGSSLSYDAATDRYIYVWKTDRAWGGTCRELIVQFTDGTDKRALFQLRK